LVLDSRGPSEIAFSFSSLTIPLGAAASEALQLAILRLRANSRTGCVRCLLIRALANPLLSSRWIVVSSSRTDFETILTIPWHHLVDWRNLRDYGAKRSDAHRGVAAALTANERSDVPALFRNISVSTAFTPVVQPTLAFSTVAFLTLLHGHWSFELIRDLSVPGRSQPVSKVCLNAQGFAGRGRWRSGQKEMRRVWSCLRLGLSGRSREPGGEGQ
jgi:hypothetical protein